MKYYQINLEQIHVLNSKHNTLILLDSALNSESSCLSYLFLNPIKTVVAQSFDEIIPLINSIDNYLKNSWICGYLSYEAAYAIEKRFFNFQSEAALKGLPLGWFGIFEEPRIFDHRTGIWNPPLPEIDADEKPIFIDGKAGNTLTVQQLIGEEKFKNKIISIRQKIEQGETYQVNYTYDVSVASELPPFSLYCQLRKNQRTPYCAYIQNEFGNVASFSPELFFKKNREKISVKPMKGTAPRGYSTKDDNNYIHFLENDPKNRAENLMIVDLIRNDLGRICKQGSVVTEKLFEVETHPTLHQMTSTVSGILRQDIEFSNIIKNIFPCGSITGAPKIRTVEIIHELEDGVRGVYCGTIGYMSPQGKGCFSIPIRTLQKPAQEKKWRYRVGSGIVWDSTPEEEWLECGHKTRFLEVSLPEFNIVETMLFDKVIHNLNDHISRMLFSATYFYYPCTKELLELNINQAINQIDKSKKHKVRVLLDKNGEITIEVSILPEPQNVCVKIFFSNDPVNEKNVFLFHKTTYRPWYLKSMENSKAGICFDTIFFNSKNEITEGAISNIFIEKNGMLYTPPVSSGLLPGILRKNLIENGKCVEKILYKEDLIKADSMYCGNSVRGLVKVSI